MLLVSVLIGTVTTLAMRSYLTDQLDQKVQAASMSAEALRDPGPRGPEGPPFGVSIAGTAGLLIAQRYPGHQPEWYASATAQRTGGRSTSHQLDSSVADVVGTVPADGQVHEVQVEGLGSYRIDACLRTGCRSGGLPTRDVDDVVSNLIWWEVLLALLAVLGAGAAALIVVRRQLRPLREVAATAHTVAGLPLAEGEIAIAPAGARATSPTRGPRSGQVGSALNTLLVHVESLVGRSGTRASSRCGSSSPTPRTSCARR